MATDAISVVEQPSEARQFPEFYFSAPTRVPNSQIDEAAKDHRHADVEEMLARVVPCRTQQEAVDRFVVATHENGTTSAQSVKPNVDRRRANVPRLDEGQEMQAGHKDYYHERMLKDGKVVEPIPTHEEIAAASFELSDNDWGRTSEVCKIIKGLSIQQMQHLFTKIDDPATAAQIERDNEGRSLTVNENTRKQIYRVLAELRKKYATQSKTTSSSQTFRKGTLTVQSIKGPEPRTNTLTRPQPSRIVEQSMPNGRAHSEAVEAANRDATDVFANSRSPKSWLINETITRSIDPQRIPSYSWIQTMFRRLIKGEELTQQQRIEILKHESLMTAYMSFAISTANKSGGLLDSDIQVSNPMLVGRTIANQPGFARYIANCLLYNQALVSLAKLVRSPEDPPLLSAKVNDIFDRLIPPVKMGGVNFKPCVLWTSSEREPEITEDCADLCKKMANMVTEASRAKSK